MAFNIIDQLHFLDQRELFLQRWSGWLLALLWLTTTLSSLAWNLHRVEQTTLETAQTHARSFFAKDAIYRQWNAMHGGVYVPVTENTPSNPHLASDQRDIITASGLKLTLINPAYMTRQIFELQKKENGIQEHITSLNPIRPKNQADTWETAALKHFELGINEVSSVEIIDDIPYMRLMKPLVAKQECLRCHAEQGYEAGDVRGGISVAIPLMPFKEIADRNRMILISWHLVLILAGLCGIYCGNRRILKNITKRKQVEFELEQAYQHLEQRVEKRTHELQQEIEERKKTENKLRKAEKMEAIGLMSGAVAHDLNNILTPIIGYPDLLLMELPENSSIREPIKIIRQSGERASEVVSDLLTVARGVVAERKTSNINIIIQDYIASPEGIDLQKHHVEVSFKVELEQNLMNVHCSPIHLRKCIMNLVGNAAEAINGKGKVTLTTRNQIIDAPIMTSGGIMLQVGKYTVVCVQDTGSGIKKEDIQHIFEPFYSKKVMGRSGTGLGLAIVWNSVQDHDGGIIVDSGPQGTMFELFFPASYDILVEENEKTALDNLKGHGETILVIDDETQSRKIADKMLTLLGYKAIAVTSGEEAVHYLQKNKVSLLVLDMQMEPRITGRETYEKIILIHPDQKAIIVSGYSEAEEIAKMKKLGVDIFLKKPLRLEPLGIAVKQALQ